MTDHGHRLRWSYGNPFKAVTDNVTEWRDFSWCSKHWQENLIDFYLSSFILPLHVFKGFTYVSPFSTFLKSYIIIQLCPYCVDTCLFACDGVSRNEGNLSTHPSTHPSLMIECGGAGVVNILSIFFPRKLC